jgi:putative tryptophan/tyrosine transport system substrate-binding protein
MRRRDFIAGLGSTAAWPVMARAQQPDRLRRVGVLMGFEEIDLEAKAFLAAFTQGLAELGWIDGRTIRIDVRWAAGSVDRARMFAKELVDLQSDVILSQTTFPTAALQRETQTIPIVFVLVYDPIGSGFVAGLPRPGGNITGFMFQEEAIVGKWLELLLEIAPGVSRVAIMFNPDMAPYVRSFFVPTFEAATRRLKVEPIVAAVRTDAEIETVITSLGRESGGALLTQGDPFTENRRALIVSTVARNNVPAVYPNSGWARDGGLLSYGPTIADEFHRAALYVDRILRGTKPADLPVQLPIKFDMVLNAKTAKALGLTVPQSILLRADEVIQ